MFKLCEWVTLIQPQTWVQQWFSHTWSMQLSVILNVLAFYMKQWNSVLSIKCAFWYISLVYPVLQYSGKVVNILYHSVRFLQMLRLFPKFLIYINLIYTAKALLHASIGLHICMVSLCWLTPRHPSILLKAALINWVCKSWHAGLPFLYTLMM